MTPKEIRLMVLYGIGGWFVALLVIRIFGPAMFDQGIRHVVFLCIACLIGWPTLWIAAKILERPQSDMVAPVVCFTLAAMLCDGLALNFAPWAYGPVGLHTGFAGGTILFGAAGGILIAVALARGKATV